MENKEEQKRLLIEIMEEDAKDGLYEKKTAVEWLYEELYGTPRTLWEDQLIKIFEQAKAMEKQQTDKAYYDGVNDERKDTLKLDILNIKN
jgi:hypothetical protein